jgi:adenylate cyclase
MAEEAPERRLAAVMYAELRNFTRLSEVLDPTKVLALANEFFALAAKAVDENTGMVIAVHNDTLLAAFDAGSDAEFAFSAITAAQAIQSQFGTVGERWQAEFGLPAAVSLGIHMGETVFGMAGPPSAQQFSALGDCVSIAERLVHRARHGEIVLSADLLKVLGDAAAELGAESLPDLDLGKRPALQIYGLVLETRLDFT